MIMISNFLDHAVFNTDSIYPCTNYSLINKTTCIPRSYPVTCEILLVVYNSYNASRLGCGKVYCYFNDNFTN